MTASRVDRYRQLFVQIGQEPALALLDRLQVLALTQPDTLREVEALIERGLRTQRFPVLPQPVLLLPKPDRRQNPDRRTVFVVPAQERRRRRLGEGSALASRD